MARCTIDGHAGLDAVHDLLAACSMRGAFHHVASDSVQIRKIVDGIATRHPEVHVTRGRKVLELRPSVAWDKGRALLHLLEALGLAGADDVVPIYIGDDRTDEDAFSVLRGVGIGILVSTVAKQTAATFTLTDPDRVGEFLEQLTAWGRTSAGNGWAAQPSCIGWSAQAPSGGACVDGCGKALPSCVPPASLASSASEATAPPAALVAAPAVAGDVVNGARRDAADIGCVPAAPLRIATPSVALDWDSSSGSGAQAAAAAAGGPRCAAATLQPWLRDSAGGILAPLCRASSANVPWEIATSPGGVHERQHRRSVEQQRGDRSPSGRHDRSRGTSVEARRAVRATPDAQYGPARAHLGVGGSRDGQARALSGTRA